MAHTAFPSDLPVPQDDGGCDHLPGQQVPSLELMATSGVSVDLSSLSGATVVFFYPRTGAPGEIVPDSWNEIPGARGCTPQSCGFRDLSKDLLQLGVSNIYGLATQDTVYQQEAKERLGLPFQLLSDKDLAFVNALKLPTFEWEGAKLVKRMALFVEDGRIVKVWYPVFPPDRNAADVVDWLKTDYQGRLKLSTEQEDATMRNLQHR